MDREKFEMLAEKAFEELPAEFKSRIENVHVAVQDYPDDFQIHSVNLSSKFSLLGLYSGVPLNKRGPNYGMYPVLPDRITLYKENIERICRNESEIEAKVREVLIHEVAHYFGMTDEEIREAGY